MNVLTNPERLVTCLRFAKSIKQKANTPTREKVGVRCLNSVYIKQINKMKKGEHVKCLGQVYPMLQDQVFEIAAISQGSLVLLIDMGTEYEQYIQAVWAVDFEVTDEPLTNSK